MSEKEDNLYVLIKEYLDTNEFKTTSEAFVVECKERGTHLPDDDQKKKMLDENEVESLLKHFDSGEREQFTKVWEGNVLPIVKEDPLDLKKMTFFLQIHFAIFPFRVAQQDENNGVPNEKSDQAMRELKSFLETRGKELMEEAECLRLFALPFANNPSRLSSFRDLFQENWLNQLRSNLQKLLDNYKQVGPIVPRLVSLVNSQQKLSKQIENHCLQDCQRRLLEAEKSYKFLKRQLTTLKSAYNKLIGVTAELTRALESAVKNEMVDLEVTLENCTQIFPELFLQTGISEDEAKFSAGEIILKSIEVGIQDLLSPIQKQDLDFKKIKETMMSGSLKTKLLLLQALRWNITRIGIEDRDVVVNAYIRNDLLGLTNLSQYTEVILGCLSTKTAAPPILQQSLARLINTLASLRFGRDYLACSPHLTNTLLDWLKESGSNSDHVTRDMVLATLQKMSLRHCERMRMINQGLMEWLVKYLSDHETLTSYSLEYSTALLMNLCLNKNGKESCIPLAHQLLKILTDMLGSQTRQVIPYVNGTLYSLLAVDEINSVANKMNLKKMLHDQMEKSSQDVHHQLNYILELHTREKPVKRSEESDDKDTETEDIDLLEEELDSEDPVKPESGDLFGEHFLNMGFRVAVVPTEMVHSVVANSSEPLTRPTTPRLQDCGGIFTSVICMSGYGGDGTEKLVRTLSVPALPTQPKIRTPRQETIAELGLPYESDRCDYISASNGSVIIVTCPTPASPSQMSERRPGSISSLNQTQLEEISSAGDKSGENKVESAEFHSADTTQVVPWHWTSTFARESSVESVEEHVSPLPLNANRSAEGLLDTVKVSMIPVTPSSPKSPERITLQQNPVLHPPRVREYQMAFTSRPKIPRTPPNKGTK